MNKKNFIDTILNSSYYTSLNVQKRDVLLKCANAAWTWYLTLPTQAKLVTKENIQKLERDCYNFILTNTRFSPTSYGYSSVFTSWIFYWVLRAIVKWVAKSLLGYLSR